MRHNNEEFIGVDYGSARVGLARGSSAARLTEPVKTVPESDALEAIKSLIKTNLADGVVVGLPRTLSGEDSPQTKIVRQWVEKTKSELNIPTYWQDEALTSAAAAEHKADDIDAAAAALILQDFLDTPKEERVRC